MPDFHSRVFTLALDAFLLIGALKLTIEQLIPLVVLCKKLIVTVISPLNSGESVVTLPAVAKNRPEAGLETNDPLVEVDVGPSRSAQLESTQLESTA